jgi:hemerythrin-like domain-containing protein
MRFLDVLMDEHRGFKTMLDVLDAAATRVERGEHVPADMLVGLIDFFDNFTDRHHDKEEEVLFPLVARHGLGPEQTVVGALLSQHDTGRIYVRRMRAHLTRMQDGEAAGSA